VTIRFSAEVARYVEESQRHSSQQCEHQPDGSLLVRLDLSGTTEVKSWVLSFGRQAEVLEPDALRSELQDELAAALKLYSNDKSLAQRSRDKERFRKAR